MDLCPWPRVTLSQCREKLGLYILRCEKDGFRVNKIMSEENTMYMSDMYMKMCITCICTFSCTCQTCTWYF